MQITLAIIGAAIFPSMLALIGILLNRSDANSIRSEINGLRSSLDGDVRILNSIVYEHHGRLKTLEKP